MSNHAFNYRFLAFFTKGKTIVRPHVVYYTPDGEPFMFNAEPISPQGESRKEIDEHINQLLEALNLEVLWGLPPNPEQYLKPCK